MQITDIIYLSGSLATGSTIGTRVGNDIDLVCLTINAGYIYSESFVIDRLRFHITYMPIYKLIDIISNDFLTPDHIYINILKGSISICNYGIEMLNEIKGYIDYMETRRMIHEDGDIIYHIRHIQDLCMEISDQRNNAAVLASDLFLTLLRFTTGLHHTTSKHLGRVALQNEITKQLNVYYRDAIKKDDYGHFVETVNNIILPFTTEEYKSSTGVSYNVQTNRCCVIYIPGRKSKTHKAIEILSIFEEHCKDYPSYSFYIDRNQVMSCGTYMFLYIADSVYSNRCIKQLYDIHKKYAERCIDEDLKVIFPYNTAFDTGYYFGGYKILESLIPLFSQLCKDIRKNGYQHVISGFKICNVWLEQVKRSYSLMQKYLDYLALYAIDPNCIYNTHQIKYMKQTLSNFYIKHSSKLDTSIEFGDEFNDIINTIIKIAKNIKADEIHVISTPLSNNKREILLFNILDHLLSICKLDAGEKYAIVYHSLKIHKKP